MPNRRLRKPADLERINLLKNSNKAVVNLSDHTLTNDEKTVLTRGLSFCPTPTRLNTIQLHTDTLLFLRRIRLHHFFRDAEPREPDKFRPTSGWTPPSGRSPGLDTFINIMQEELLKTRPTRQPNQNITDRERKALNILRENNNLIIKPADKGGAIVLLNKSDYIQEGLRQLQDKRYYVECKTDMTPKITTDIQKFLKFAKNNNLLKRENVDYLTPRNPRTPIFYLLPKIHKKGNPGRPIVSACDSPTERLSEFVDSHIQELAKKVPSYLKDTNHFLQKLETLEQIPPNALLVTIDVTSLYTNIPHREGILAVKEALENRNTDQPPTWILLRMIHFIMTKTYFRFQNKFYHQVSGTSMGTKCAPSYAILFMDKIETTYLRRQTLSPLVWWRFIDDIFMIWPHSREALSSFIEGLNSHHNTIKFTAEISEDTANFMDVTVSKDKEGKLHTTLYTKPTDAHLFLHYHSYHPTHQKKSIPFSQALRIRRICSSETEFRKCAATLKANLLQRAYPTDIINRAIKQAASLNRKDTLQTKETKPTETKTIPLVLQFNPDNPPADNIIAQHLHILNRDPTADCFKDTKLRTVFRRAKSIRQTLVRTDVIRSTEPRGSYPCGKNCMACKHILPKTDFTSTDTGKKYNIYEHLNCRTVSIIYLITCKKCNKQYVGQTGNTFRERLYGHLADIRAENDVKPIAQHFSGNIHDVNDVDVTLLQTTPKNLNGRLRIEETWIHKLATRTPRGLNLIQ